MKPVYPIIGLVRIQPQKKYNVGDVVMFENNGRLLLPRYYHRITSINNKTFTTMGDNRQNSDRYEVDVPVDNIEGRVIDFKKIL